MIAEDPELIDSISPSHWPSAPVVTGGHMGCREMTFRLHGRAIERTILTMREHLGEPLPLRQMAQDAYLSPYHFDRVFAEITGLPPCRFLAALRMDAAKHLLLSTQMSVLDICLEVGYQSIGSFTTQFTQLVGTSPRRFRRVPAELPALWPSNPAALNAVQHVPQPAASSRIVGTVTGDWLADSPIFVGLFDAPCPVGSPVSCAILAEPGAFQFPPVNVQHASVFAMSIPRATRWREYLLPKDTDVRVARSGALRPASDHGPTLVDLVLRAPQITDPPILVALPALAKRS